MTRSFHKSFLYGAAALAVMAVPAQAEPGSSDRLLDLERIIEQQQQMIKNQAEAFEALKSRIESVESRTQANTDAVTKNKEAVTAATRSVRRIDSAAVPPKMASSGNPNVKLSISGWASRKVMWADDGKDSRTMVADDFNLPTRLRFVGKGKVDEKLSVGTIFEVGMNPNPSGLTTATGAISILNNASSIGFTGNLFAQRKTDAWIAYKGLGKVSFGFGDPAANSVNHNDNTGSISAALPFGAAFIAGGVSFRNSATGAAVAQTAAIFSDYDHVSRRNRVRYDTPNFGGFTLGTSFIDAGGAGWDIAARYKGKLGNFKVKSALAYTNCNACNGAGVVFGPWQANRSIFSGSVSVKHSSGIGAVFGGGVMDLEEPLAGQDDPTGWIGKLTYSMNAINYGATTIGIDISTSDDLVAAGDEGLFNSIFINQQLKKGSTDVYARIGRFDLDRPGTPTDDIWIVQIGSRISF